MRIGWLLAAVVAVAVAFVLGVASQGVVTVEGVARPAPGDPNLVVLTRCVRGNENLRHLDLDGVRVGPLIQDSTGDRIFGLTKDRTLIDCADNSGVGSGPLSVPPPEEKARFAGTSYTQGASVIVGFGQVAPDVVRLDAVLPGGGVVEAEIAGGLFAFVAAGTDPDVDIVLRAHDEDGDVIYESAPGH